MGKGRLRSYIELRHSSRNNSTQALDEIIWGRLIIWTQQGDLSGKNHLMSCKYIAQIWLRYCSNVVCCNSSNFKSSPQQEEDWSAAMMINQENVEQAALWPNWGIITPDDPNEQSEPELLKRCFVSTVYYYECFNIANDSGKVPWAKCECMVLLHVFSDDCFYAPLQYCQSSVIAN